MFPYLLVFVLSLYFIYLAQRSRNGTLPYRLCLLLAILFPAMLAGLRDNTIGTDVLTYVDDTWNSLKSVNSLNDLFQKIKDDYFEVADKGYLLLNYFLRTISNNPHLIYFGTSFFTMTFVVLAVRDNKNKASMTLMFFLFLFLNYNLSLNMVRQMMAMGIGLYTYKFLEKRKWRNLCFAVAFMFMFHSTSFAYLLCVVLFVVYNIKNKKLRAFLLAGLLSFMLISFSYFNELLTFILAYGLVPMHYSLYFSQEEGVLQTSMLVMYFIFLFIFLCARKYTKNAQYKKEITYYAVFHLSGTLLSMLSVIAYDANRLASYTLMISIVIFLPRSLYIVKHQSPSMHFVLQTTAVLLTIVVWYYINIYLRQNETYPYKSSILGI